MSDEALLITNEMLIIAKMECHKNEMTPKWIKDEENREMPKKKKKKKIQFYNKNTPNHEFNCVHF